MRRTKMGVGAALCLLVLLASFTKGELVTDQEMRNVADNWVAQTSLREGAWAGRTDASVVASSDVRSENGELLGRVFHVSPVGYVVVPVLREMPPVKMYSDESNLDPTRSRGAADLVRDMLSRRLEAFRFLYGSLETAQPERNGLFSSSYKKDWDRLSKSPRNFRATAALEATEEAGPLLSSVWYQDAPYNDSCPMGVSGRCYVGCGATACGLIMDYWEWPERGVGEHSYWWAGDTCYGGSVPGDSLYADFSDSYDWANIIDDYHSVSTTPEQDAAVAELCYEIGVAMEMEYGSCASGTAGTRDTVMSKYFRYARDMCRERREDYGDPYEWYSMIKSEIDAGRPIRYGIPYHGLVCDGYRDINGYLEYHMNYGWDHHNAWYVLDSLYCYWLPDSLCPYDGESMCVNIRPQYDPILRLKGHTLSETAGDGDGHADAGEVIAVNVSVHNEGNDAVNASATLSTTDSYVSATSAASSFPADIAWGGDGATATPFTVEISGSCPDPHVAVMEVELSADGGYLVVDSFLLFIGDTPGFSNDFESGAALWTHESWTAGFVDDWHMETVRRYSGAHSWKYGGTSTADYSNLSDGALISPPFLVPQDGNLSFYHWLYAEEDNPTMAWDGAAIMVGTGNGQWQFIEPIGGYTHSITNPTQSPFEPGTHCFSGAHDWQKVTFELDSYASQVIQIMFRFGSDGNTAFEGWYVDDVMVCNTNAGSEVTVHPSDSVVVTFDQVTAAGLTQVNVSTEGPVIPAAWQCVPADPALFYEITTTATCTGSLQVCITYDENDVIGPESDLEIRHFDGVAWSDITTSVDEPANAICGSCTSLSEFVVVENCCMPPTVGDIDQSGVVDISDIQLLVDNQFITLTPLDCEVEGDADLSGGVDITDLSILIDNQFLTLTPLPACP